MELIFSAIVAGFLSLASADVGFADSDAYLVTEISKDNQSLRFSLSEKSSVLDRIDLKSEKYFNVARLRKLIDSSNQSISIKNELHDMLSGSLMSRHPSLEFMSALKEILSQYESQEKFEL